MSAGDERRFALGERPAIRGEGAGQGLPVVLCHGVTATRRYVLHGSRALERAGHRVVAYDARGHGESDPAPPGEGYGYPELSSDLERVISAEAAAAPVLAGHSMGAHTVLSHAIAHPGEVAGLVVIGPTYTGEIRPESVEYWDGLADALDEGGIIGFLGYLDRNQGTGGRWRDSVRRFTRERLEAHRDLAAVAEAVRQVPRSRPFGGMGELERLELPALIVGSRDEADPGHPLATAEDYAEALPRARLVVEEEGQSPLAWQGGRLSREIAAFCEEIGPAAAGR